MTSVVIAFTCLMVIVIFRFPLGFAMMLVGFVGLWLLNGFEAALHTVGFEIVEIGTNFGFVVLPLFVLMGVFVARARLSDDLYEASDAWLGHFRGGLAMATVAACGGFAAVSGSSAATAATMAKIAIPSMRRYGYSDSLAAGTVAAGGTIGILIPPSAAMIIYGILTESDIGKLFVAGIVPGLLTLVLYGLTIMIFVRIWPHTGPRGDASDWRTRFILLGRVWGVLVLFFLILGGIFFGIYTPSEAGAIGAAGALLFAIGRRKINLKQFYASLVEAGIITAQIFTVAFGALILNQFINLSGMPEAIINFIEALEVSNITVIFIILGIYVILGMFTDGFSMIFISVPIFVPIVQALGMDLIWWGIVTVMVVEISLITPPIGLNVFVLKTMLPDVPLATIFKGIGPFFVADLIRLAIVVLFPMVALWLPTVMG
jgi:tripartite ATP-independent transporter DctM subunit